MPALLKGLWFAHIGWLFDVEQTNQQRFTPDLLADPDIVRVEQAVQPAGRRSACSPPAVLGGLITWSLDRRAVGVLLGRAWSGSACCTT